MFGEVAAKEISKSTESSWIKQLKGQDLSRSMDELSKPIAKEISEKLAPEMKNIEVEKLKQAYFQELKEYSQYPETIEFPERDFEKVTPEECKQKKTEFEEVKDSLIKQWEIDNNMPWPTYTKTVYSPTGKEIRKAGDRYDAHHIHPITLGGENVSSNITPLHASIHFDKLGIHAPDSSYGKLDKLLKGA